MTGFLVCFAVFLTAVIGCIVLDWSLLIAVWLGIAVFFLLGYKQGLPCRTMAADAWTQGRKMCTLIVIYALIGTVTALWRGSGTIAFFIYYGLQLIRPQLFLLVAFLLTAVLAYALGSSFGVAGTAGVILMAMARSGGVNEAVAAGVLLSAIYFGDRGAPTSSCASLVAALTKTELYRNVRQMHRTAALPYALTLAFYILLFAQAKVHRTIDEFFSFLAGTPRIQ